MKPNVVGSTHSDLFYSLPLLPLNTSSARVHRPHAPLVEARRPNVVHRTSACVHSPMLFQTLFYRLTLLRILRRSFLVKTQLLLNDFSTLRDEVVSTVGNQRR
ncbi:hypothetical protein MtrunA17_Chr1g0196271 [Medicago truncatula]|uniref:Uncharacterized protein n=1 Tax=Medicago truncatula TaxID=3880 RepID=A0A396JWK5_MEDTR|nr:hypothetical protein MtrunA17_Chr1g0196271 [Medicago truncatula]